MADRLIEELRRLGERELAEAIDRGESAVAYANEPAARLTASLAGFCAGLAAHRGGLAITMLAAADRLSRVEALAAKMERCSADEAVEQEDRDVWAWAARDLREAIRLAPNEAPAADPDDGYHALADRIAREHRLTLAEAERVVAIAQRYARGWEGDHKRVYFDTGANGWETIIVENCPCGERHEIVERAACRGETP